jgi:hypothetical protein
MMAAIVTRDMVGEFEAVVLENALLRAVIIPALGGRVWELEDRLRARQWIWHNNKVPLAASPIGAVYDDVWAGGWEELFPNDAPVSFEGRTLPDHGEWWTMRWEVDDFSSGPAASLRLTAQSSVVKAICVKEFRLGNNESTLSIGYRIQSLEPGPFHFLFKQHFPVSLTHDCRLLLPGGRVEAVSPAFGTILAGGEPFDWPIFQKDDHAVDMSVIPPRSIRAREFLYVRDLPQPWCGIEDTRLKASIRMEFDARELPFVWLFLSYGGWKDLYTAVLEPCSNLPKDLAEAVRLGQSAKLEPGKDFKTEVSVVLAGPPEKWT